MYKLYKSLQEEKICLSYLGVFNDDITDKLIGVSEAYLEHSNQLSKLKNKVSILIAECFQNVVRHGIDDEIKMLPPSHKDFFQLDVLDDRVVLSSCNLIDNKYIVELKQKIQQVNSLGSDELKKLYNEVLANEGVSSKGGAGLGLIEMARKSGLPLKYNFTTYKENYSEFFLELEIIGNKELDQSAVSISQLENFHRELSKDNVLILYRGEFSKETVSPLIEMLENSFVNAGKISSKEKKGVITLIEILQNISKHGKLIDGTREGIFSISESTDGMLVVESGNFIDKEKVTVFKQTIDSLKKMSIDEITSLYKKRLVSTELSIEGDGGLGLLEIARNATTNFNCTFIDTPEQETFFSIKATI